MMRTLLFSLFLVVSFLYSCSDENPVVVYDVDDEFVLRLAEDLKDERRELKLLLRTRLPYDCDQVEIKHQVLREGTSTRVVITQLVVPEGCEHGGSQARTEINLGEFPIGTHDLILQIGNNVQNTGVLVVATDRYAIQVENPVALIMEQTEILKIPEGLMWGWLSYPNQNLNYLPSDLIQKFDAYAPLLLPDSLQPGTYTGFKVVEGGFIEPDAAWMLEGYTLHDNIGNFRFIQPQEDFSWLGEVLAQFDTQNASQVPYTYYFYTARGDEFIKRE